MICEFPARHWKRHTLYDLVRKIDQTGILLFYYFFIIIIIIIGCVEHLLRFSVSVVDIVISDIIKFMTQSQHSHM